MDFPRLAAIPVLFVVAGIGPSLAADDPGPCSNESVRWSFQWENDSFPGASREGSDRFYTNGVRLTRTKNGDGNRLLKRLLDQVWFPDESGRPAEFCLRSGIRIGHQFYTPQTITSSQLDEQDRPYAGLLYGTLLLAQASRSEESSPDSPTVVRSAELQFGVVGPAAGGRTLQSEWHRLSFIDAPIPRGWHHQLPNEPVVNLNMSAARRFPISRQFDVVHKFDASVGTIFTGARLRATARYGNDLRRFPYNRVEPTIMKFDSTSADAKSLSLQEPGIAWWLFVGAEGEAVVHDIFLDGTLFSDSHSFDSRNFRTVVTAGLHFELRSFVIDLMWVSHSKEFETQATGVDRHEYMSLNFEWYGK